jgi:hypothetical protein
MSAGYGVDLCGAVGSKAAALRRPPVGFFAGTILTFRTYIGIAMIPR